MKGIRLASLLVLMIAGSAAAQDSNALARLDARLVASLAELATVRKTIGDEKLPLTADLSRLEGEAIEARKAYEDVKRRLDGRSLDVHNLTSEIKSREQEKAYLSNLIGEYLRNLQTRLHIVELQRHGPAIEAALLAPGNANLKPAEVFARQAETLEASIGRLEELLGGARFAGRAAGEDGIVKPGSFILLGPLAYYASDDGTLAGVAQQRLGSLEPVAMGYADPSLAVLTRTLVKAGTGLMPFDASLGNAHKVEQTKETLREHILKGGPVMAPILGLAGAALLVALVKWVILALVRLPSPRQLQPLLDAVRQKDAAAAATAVARLRGPVGAMLSTGVKHLAEPKDLIEEAMFEDLLGTRFRLQRALPFIAVSAACAPLLGLLGTVTGIINTFKLITVFGSGDVKMLSAGISEALITTEYGLYVAIPAVLMHAFLARKAKTIVDRMEQVAIGFLNAIAQGAAQREAGA
jgi:biopolymer transport protein ExbB